MNDEQAKKMNGTMQSLNKILHQAFSDIVEISLEYPRQYDSDGNFIGIGKERTMKIATKNACYWFFETDGKWRYDGWSNKP